MYGIYRVGADGELLTLIGSQNSDSGGNSMAPAVMIDPAVRPTKVDRASDVTGLVDTGELGTLFTEPGRRDRGARIDDAPRRIAKTDLAADRSSSAPPTQDATCSKLVRCGYVKSTYLADRFRTPAALNPDLDPNIVGAPAGIFTQAEYDGDGEFRKTAAVMKMVINGYAGAGTITMGGYDYHGQGRNTGEMRNFRAGRCIGACLEYAARMQQAAHDLRVQRRLAVGERRGRQHRRRPRQVRLGERQPVDRRVVLPGVQARHGAAVRGFAQPARASRSATISAGGVGRHRLEPGGERRQPAGRDRDAQLHGAARRGGQLRRPLFPTHGLGGTALATASRARADRVTARSATRSERQRAGHGLERASAARCRVLPTLPCSFSTPRNVARRDDRTFSNERLRFVDIVKWAMRGFRARRVESGSLARCSLS